MAIRSLSCGALVVVLAALLSCCHAKDKLVGHKLTDAAILFVQPMNPSVTTYKYRKVPYFPGTLLATSPCGGFGALDREVTVSATNITFTASQRRTPFGNSASITYLFRTATLVIRTYNNNPGNSLTTSSWTLSSLLDNTDAPSEDYATIYRKIAVDALETLIKYIAPFSKPNKQVVCRDDNPYSPKVTNLVAYLKSVQSTLQKFA